MSDRERGRKREIEFIGADSRVLQPRVEVERVRAKKVGRGEKEEEEEEVEGERCGLAHGTSRKRERRPSAPNMQQEKKNWRSIGSSW